MAFSPSSSLFIFIFPSMAPAVPPLNPSLPLLLLLLSSASAQLFDFPHGYMDNKHLQPFEAIYLNMLAQSNLEYGGVSMGTLEKLKWQREQVPWEEYLATSTERPLSSTDFSSSSSSSFFPSSTYSTSPPFAFSTLRPREAPKDPFGRRALDDPVAEGANPFEELATRAPPGAAPRPSEPAKRRFAIADSLPSFASLPPPPGHRSHVPDDSSDVNPFEDLVTRAPPGSRPHSSNKRGVGNFASDPLPPMSPYYTTGAYPYVSSLLHLPHPQSIATYSTGYLTRDPNDPHAGHRQLLPPWSLQPAAYSPFNVWNHPARPVKLSRPEDEPFVPLTREEILKVKKEAVNEEDQDGDGGKNIVEEGKGGGGERDGPVDPRKFVNPFSRIDLSRPTVLRLPIPPSAKVHKAWKPFTES